MGELEVCLGRGVESYGLGVRCWNPCAPPDHLGSLTRVPERNLDCGFMRERSGLKMPDVLAWHRCHHPTPRRNTTSRLLQGAPIL